MFLMNTKISITIYTSKEIKNLFMFKSISHILSNIFPSHVLNICLNLIIISIYMFKKY